MEIYKLHLNCRQKQKDRKLELLERKEAIRYRDNTMSLLGNRKKKMPLIDTRRLCLIDYNNGMPREPRMLWNRLICLKNIIFGIPLCSKWNLKHARKGKKLKLFLIVLQDGTYIMQLHIPQTNLELILVMRRCLYGRRWFLEPTPLR
jgi:hypothetical protein